MISAVEHCSFPVPLYYRSLYHVDRSVKEQGDTCEGSEKFIMADPVGFKMSTQVNCWEILTFSFLVFTVLFNVTRFSDSSVCVHKETMYF